MTLTKRGGWPYSNPPNSSFTLNTQSPQAKGLLAWWPMSGQYGNTATIRDYVTNRYPMTQFNTPTWKSYGEVGQALGLDDGSSEYLAYNGQVVSAYPFSMSCWFTSDDATISQVLMCVCDKDVTSNRHMLTLSGTVAGDPVRAYSDSGKQAYSTAGYTVNKWHLAVGVWVGNSLRYAYIDGGFRGSNGDAAATNTGNQDIAALGMARDSTPNDPLSGAIADARIYNRALSDAEVWAMYANRWELYAPVMPLTLVGVPATYALPIFSSRGIHSVIFGGQVIR